MKTKTTLLLKACSISVALLGSAAVILAISLPEAAYAEKGNGNGNGGGNGNGNSGAKSGGNGGNSSASSKASEKSKSERKATKKAAATGGDDAEVVKTRPKKKKPADTDGLVHPSELGALNAARANPKALENAAPNSRIGRIAAYRDAVLAGRELSATLEERQALLDTLSSPDRPLAEIDADLALAKAEVAAETDAIAGLEADLLAAGGSDPVIEADLASARLRLSDAEARAGDLQAEQTAALAYEALAAEVADLNQKVADQPQVERSALEAAANKPVTDDVEAAVKVLLGL